MAAAEVKQASVPCVRTGVRIRRVRGALLVAPADSDSAVELADSAMFLFRAFDGKRTITDIAGMLAEEYQISLELAVEDTMSFVADLLEEGVLELGGGAP